MIRYSKTKKGRTSGTAVRNRIVITIGEGSDWPEVAATLLHLVTLAALPRNRGHRPHFWAYFKQAAEEAWPGLKVPALSGPGWNKHKAVLEAIREATKKKQVS